MISRTRLNSLDTKWLVQQINKIKYYNMYSISLRLMHGSCYTSVSNIKFTSIFNYQITLHKPLAVQENDRLGFTTSNAMNSTVLGYEFRDPGFPWTYNDIVLRRVAPPPAIRGGTLVFGEDVMHNYVFFIASDINISALLYHWEQQILC